MCTGSSPLPSALEKRVTPLAGPSKGYDGIVSPTVFSVSTVMQDNTCHVLECTSISRKVKDLTRSECYREVHLHALPLQGKQTQGRSHKSLGNPLSTPALLQKSQTFPHTHTADPDTRGTPEGIGADNVANSHDFIMNLVMVNVCFKVPGVSQS